MPPSRGPAAPSPASEVNPAAIEAMAERDINISGEYPKPWTDEIVQAADVVITMGCGDACPIFPGRRYEEWVLDDPRRQDVDAVRPIRDEIERRVRAAARRTRSSGSCVTSAPPSMQLPFGAGRNRRLDDRSMVATEALSQRQRYVDESN